MLRLRRIDFFKEGQRELSLLRRRKTGSSVVRDVVVKGQKTPLGYVRNVYLDFDDTIAEGLSTDVQLKAIVKDNAQTMTTPEAAQKFVKDRSTLIAELAEAYYKDERTNLNNLIERFPKEDVFRMSTIDAAMEMCAIFDNKWYQTSMDALLLKGVRRDAFLGMAKMTPLKEDALHAIEGMRSSGLEVAIVSINWSADWIRRIVGEDGIVVDIHDAVPKGKIGIYSNELIYEDDVSTGKLSIMMGTGQDKAEVMRKLLERTKENNGIGKSVFVGDSINDIQSLLMVDVGIVLGKNAILMQFAEHFNIRCRPLSEAPSETDDGSPVIYTAESWSEVAEAILGREKTERYLDAVAQ